MLFVLHIIIYILLHISRVYNYTYNSTYSIYTTLYIVYLSSYAVAKNHIRIDSHPHLTVVFRGPGALREGAFFSEVFGAVSANQQRPEK